jgi:uncharacterized protein
MNKETLTLIGGALAFGAALLIATRPAPVTVEAARASATSDSAPTRTLHTDGSAVVRVQPDRVTVRLGVETFAATPRESHASNARLVESVIEAVRATGIAAQDIATDYFAVRPEYDYSYSSNPRKVTGYWTRNTVMVTLRQAAKLGDVLTNALEAGATYVDDVTFSTTRLRELRDQARAMAAKAALEKAQGLAGAVNAQVGDVQSINDNTQWAYYGWSWNSRASVSANMANVVQNVAQAAPDPQQSPEDGEFSLGQIAVQAQVDLVVALK